VVKPDKSGSDSSPLGHPLCVPEQNLCGLVNRFLQAVLLSCHPNITGKLPVGTQCTDSSQWSALTFLHHN